LELRQINIREWMPYRHYLRDEGFVYHNGCPTDIIFLKEIKLMRGSKN